MNLHEFQEELFAILHPEPDEDGFPPLEYPHSLLSKKYALDFEYMRNDAICGSWEGSSTHRFTRLCPENSKNIHVLTRNQDVPDRLFYSALRLFADSMIAYHGQADRQGDLRFFPPVLLTFWAGFETFVRRLSELMIATVKEIPEPVCNFLQEREPFVDAKGAIHERSRFQSVLDRYAVLLRYGYALNIPKGDRFWQRLVKAKDLRDYYTHLDVREPRSVTSTEVLNFTESILLGIIWPSSLLQRTLLLGVFRVYELWELLSRFHEPYEERPFFLDWHLERPYLFHCNFENVDAERFPNRDEERLSWERK